MHRGTLHVRKRVLGAAMPARETALNNPQFQRYFIPPPPELLVLEVLVSLAPRDRLRTLLGSLDLDCLWGPWGPCVPLFEDECGLGERRREKLREERGAGTCAVFWAVLGWPLVDRGSGAPLAQLFIIMPNIIFPLFHGFANTKGW